MKDIEKIEEYKAMPIQYIGENKAYDSRDIQLQNITEKLNEVIDYINSKKDQLL